MRDDDPLIHGPRRNAERATQSSASALPPRPMDLENSAPPQDFVNMLRNPARFFASVPVEPSNLLLTKALVGAIAMTLLAKFVSTGFHLDTAFENIETWLPQILDNVPIRNPFMGPLIKRGMMHLQQALAVMGHLSLLALPLMLISEWLMKALSLRLFIPLLSSHSPGRLSLRRLLVILSFPQWLGILGVIPFSSWLVGLAIFAFTLNALRSVFDLPWIKILLAYFLLDLIVNLLLLALAGVFVFTLTLA